MSDSRRNSQPAPKLAPASSRTAWADICFCLLLVFAGLLFLHDAPHWGRQAYVGSAQYGDAEFWWNGALHFSEGIVAENPNLTFRMGYAAFGGAVAAVLGPEYRHFHLVLLACFLATAAGLFLALRRPLGRLAAAIAVCGLVFNPFTAEWLAISTSDGLGMALNLAALLALGVALRSPHQKRWIALFGILFSANSLTRPLMTPFIAAAALLVFAHNWGAWRKASMACATLGAAFAAPTLAWMLFMGATTGNFALTGASQDSSSFYAASDPTIQVWRGDMYEGVRESARTRYSTQNPTPAQLNAEFWNRTRQNYIEHWRFHAARLGRHARVVASFSAEQSAPNTPALAYWHTTLKLAVVAALAVFGWREGRRFAAGGVALLGLPWALSLTLQPWFVLAAVALGIACLFTRNRLPFLWSAYWLAGMFALYLTGGTWGPPLGPVHAINALGYRLGFQFLFTNDLLVTLALGWLAIPDRATLPAPADLAAQCFRPSSSAERLLRTAAAFLVFALATLLGSGGAIVCWRIATRSRTPKIAYPPLATLLADPRLSTAKPATDITTLRVAINNHQSTCILTTGTSSGFLWNLPGQERAVLLLYQQDLVRPIHLAPRWFHAEVPRHLAASTWLNRQGGWLLRSFPDSAPPHNLPYYINSPAIQAFIPLTPDGTAFDIAGMVVFPIAKYASQLAETGELTFTGLRPEWSMSSGSEKFPRRLALRAEGADPQTPRTLRFDLGRTSGVRILRFATRLASDGPGVSSTLRLFGEPATGNSPLWLTTLGSGETSSLPASIEIPTGTATLRLECELTDPAVTLWFNELVLVADDFAQ